MRGGAWGIRWVGVVGVVALVAVGAVAGGCRRASPVPPESPGARVTVEGAGPSGSDAEATDVAAVVGTPKRATTVAPAPSGRSGGAVPTRPAAGGGGRPLLAPEPTAGVRFRLRDADPATLALGSPAPTVASTPLGDDEVAPLFARLAPLPTAEGPAVAFARRSPLRPPAKAGVIVQAPFPPMPVPVPPLPAARTIPLEVLRHQPEGDVDKTERVVITFNQPMVPVTSHAALAARDVPARLDPQPAGTWQWIDTRTLAFLSADRFPGATVYRVEVPAGTRSAFGGTLAEPVRWEFRTSPVAVVTTHPGCLDAAIAFDVDTGWTEPQPVIFVTFDQRIEPSEVRDHVRATYVDGQTRPHPRDYEVINGARFDLRLATADEIAADVAVAALVDGATDGRWAALVPSAPLPAGARVAVQVGPGLESAEGPIESTTVDRFFFKVYGPLTVESAHCDGAGSQLLRENGRVRPGYAGSEWSRENGRVRPVDTILDECPARGSWTIELTNGIDAASLDGAVEIEPPLPDARIESSGHLIEITGSAARGSAHTVRLNSALRDVRGQALEEPAQFTFHSTARIPDFTLPGGDGFVLDPGGPKGIDVYSVNVPELYVHLYQVVPADWVALAGEQWRDDFAPWDPPGSLVWSGVVRPKGTPDVVVRSLIDLAPALREGAGQVFVAVSQAEPPPSGRPWRNGIVESRWIQVTDLGLTAFEDGEDLTVWATSLTDGSPKVDAAVTLHRFDINRKRHVPGTPEPPMPGPRTNGDGVTALTLPAGEDEEQIDVLEVRLGDDATFIASEWGSRWRRRVAGETLAWYVLDDRGLYQPGEEMHVKGWLRRSDPGKRGDVGPVDAAGWQVDASLVTWNDKTVASETWMVDAHGGFAGVVRLPDDVEPGSASLRLAARGEGLPANGGGYVHAVGIAEFRRPEFEVAVAVEAPAYVFGETAVVAAQADYYAGGSLSRAQVRWSVRAEPGHFAPPGHDDFSFGMSSPWWSWWADERAWTGTYEDLTGHTDVGGAHRLAIDLEGVDPVSPVSFAMDAAVQDVNRQTWSASTRLLVHPARVYAGLRPDHWYVQPGVPLTVEGIVADLDGALVPDRPIDVTVERIEWDWAQDVETIEAVATCRLVSTADPVACTFTPQAWGRHRVTAEVTDADGRANVTTVTVWVQGGWEPPQSETVTAGEIRLVPDAPEYQPGQTAEILIEAPFAPAEGLLTVQRSGLVRAERFHLTGTTAIVRVPIEEAYTPNLTVQIDLVGTTARDAAIAGVGDLPPRPAFATGSVGLAVPPRARTLDVAVAPRDAALEPGGRCAIDVVVRDAAGAPLAGAQVAVVVVDEAVLAVSGYHVPDPMAMFYPARSAGVTTEHQREQVLVVDPADLVAQVQAGPGGLPLDLALTATALWSQLRATAPPPAPQTGGGVDDGEVVRERMDFNPVAAFVPDLLTDAEGRASAEFVLPDNVTRYRITAVATDGSRRFGRGESSLVARLPLIARPSPPRFLNYGDTFELPVVVQNQTEQALEALVVVRAVNLALTEGQGRRVIVPAGDRVEVRFPAAVVQVGKATFQVGVFGAAMADAQRFSVPVWTPATTEAFAVYGELDAGAAAQPILAPTDVVTTVGGLGLTTSSTALSALTDAYLYLYRYPYECSEQIASRLVATVALRDVLEAFQVPELPSRTEIDASVARDIEVLAGREVAGDFRMWDDSDVRDGPWLTVHVAHALARAKDKGYWVSPDLIERVEGSLERIDERLPGYPWLERIDERLPGYHWLEWERATRAYALFVRALFGTRDTAEARAILAEKGTRSVETLGWLLYVLGGDERPSAAADQIRRQLAARVSETARTAQFTESYNEESGRLILASDRRSDAVALETLIVDQPESDLIPKLARGLLEHRVAGRWATTQESAFVLLALDRYFRTFEAQTPSFVARAWLGDTWLGDHRFTGRSTEQTRTDVPMSALPRAGTSTVTIAREGTGRLYYRLGLSYAPSDLALEPLDRGFAVARTYEAVDDPLDVRRTADGGWEVLSGARVRVRLSMIAPERRYQVALVDALPAGLEAIQPDLGGSGSLTPDLDGDHREWWHWRWYGHEAFRSERVELFSTALEPGVYEYAYFARATTPGVFVAPPTKAEEMYAPETFGRGGTDRVVVR